MNIEYILIVLGEPYSTFSEILGKYFKNKKNLKKKIILIGNLSLLNKQLKKLRHSFPLHEISDINYAKNNIVNIINIKFKHKKVFDKISNYSNKYIENCFKKSLDILKDYKDKALLINGPISKTNFLNRRYLGITEYLSKKTRSRNEVMLIYNNKLSVSPLTTHIPIKYVSKRINQSKITKNIVQINNFYKKYLRKKIKLAVLGLNPHCETIDKFSEEKNIIIPSIKRLKKKDIIVDGPYPADTFFIKKNINYYDVILGMYHDQVLTPIKTIYNFKAINITIGLPFIRITPDHGPNSKMLGKNKSDPSSFVYAMKFIENLK